VEPAELGAMFDALGTLFHSDRAEARLTLGQPVYALVPNDEDRWMVVRMEDGDEHVLANVMAKRTAVDMARRRARDAGGTLVVHRLDGSVQSTYHYGAPAADRDGLASTGELVSLDAHRT
jgi:hypothetical protein